ncbi:MAG: hypothetical protein O2868_15850 [Proteobacteria bacterium]|nr:hypothetical protein [Pseudomonadota bacterium]
MNTSLHDKGVTDPGTLRAFMEVLAARCAVRKTSRHDNGVPDPGTLRAPHIWAWATLAQLARPRHAEGSWRFSGSSD